MRALALLALPLLVLACAPEPAPDPDASEHPAAVLPPLETRADSLAARALEATGGAAWSSAPALRFSFAVERDGERTLRARHAWDRTTNDYRVAWPASADSVYTVLMNLDTRTGRAFVNGIALDSAATVLALETAYGRYINDTYWLAAPAKLLDEGVNRALAPDSSTAQAEALALSFGNVGLTPGDRYWVWIDRASGRMARWAYILEGQPAEGPASAWVWTGYQTFDTPAGPVTLATRKEQPGGAVALLTDEVSLEPLPAGLLQDSTASLQ